MANINLTSEPVTLSSLRSQYHTHLLVWGETKDTLTFPAWRIRQRKLEQREAAAIQSYMANEENAEAEAQAEPIIQEVFNYPYI